jgi:hypothetical protein
VTACNNWQILLIIQYVHPDLGAENSLISSPTGLQYSVFTLIFKVYARTCARLILFQNSSYVFFKYQWAHINEMFMLCLLQNWVYGCGSFMLTVIDVKVFPVCIVDMIEFTLVFFWIELWQLLVRQKYHSLESLYKFWPLAWSILSVSSGNVFPKELLWVVYN